MTLQQLRYLIPIAETGSMSASGQRRMYAIESLDCGQGARARSFGIGIFTRTNRGVALTNEGTNSSPMRGKSSNRPTCSKSITRARAMRHASLSPRSTMRFAFATFIDTVDSCEDEEYDFIMREAATGRSSMACAPPFPTSVSSTSRSARRPACFGSAFEDAQLVFHPLFEAPVNVFVGEHHPLGRPRFTSTLDELGGLSALFVRTGRRQLILLFRRNRSRKCHTSGRYAFRGPRHALESAHDFDGYTLSTGIPHPRDARRHRDHPA